MTLRACIKCGALSEAARCPQHALRKRPRGNAFEPTRQRILQRDGHRCQLRLDCCTGHATAVDHIIHFANGGSDDDTNLRAACEPCNQKRGDR